MASPTRFESLLLVIVALFSFPFSVFYLAFNYACLILVPQNALRRRIRRTPGFRPKKILISGSSSPQAIRLARAFYDTGHTVVATDHEPRGIPIHTRWSAAVAKFIRLRGSSKEETFAQTAEHLAEIISKERIDLWIDCSTNSSATSDARMRQVIKQKTTCICFGPSLSDASSLATQTDFLAFARKHELPVPESYQVQSRGDIHKVLNRSKGRRQYRLNAPDDKSVTLLPRRTLSQTYGEVARLRVTKATPLLLEQYVEGLERYTTFSVVVQGKIRAFVASAIFDSESHQPLPPDSTLNQAFLRCAQNVVKNFDSDFSSHLCIDFCVDEKPTDTGVEKNIHPIDARAAIEPSALLFYGTHGSLDLVRAYLALFAPNSNGAIRNNGLQLSDPPEEVAMPPATGKGVYTFATDALQLLLQPSLKLLSLRLNPVQYIRYVLMFFNHIIFWQESLFDFRDPGPFWYLYQIYLPGRLLLYSLGRDTKRPILEARRMIE